MKYLKIFEDFDDEDEEEIEYVDMFTSNSRTINVDVNDFINFTNQYGFKLRRRDIIVYIFEPYRVAFNVNITIDNFQQNYENMKEHLKKFEYVDEVKIRFLHSAIYEISITFTEYDKHIMKI